MFSEISVVSLTERDVCSLQELLRTSGPYVAERRTSDYWLYARLFHDTCLGVKDNAVLVGALIAFRDQARGFREIYIQDVAVCVDWRGRGIAKAMISELLRRARQWKVNRVWLTSEVDNLPAIAVWRKLGFTNEKADYIQDDLWVTRNLKGPGQDRVVFSLQM